MTPSPSQEFLLVAACSAWPPTDRRTESIHALAAGNLDWTRVVHTVARHRVAGLVHEGLSHTRSTVPLEAARAIGAQAETVVRQNLACAAEALKLQRLFADAGLPVVFFKGVSLAMLIYGNLALRHSRDIDILAAPGTLEQSAALLEHAGYRRFQPPPDFTASQLKVWMQRCKELRYIHREKKIEVELHSRLFDNPRMTVGPLPATEQLRLVPLGNDIGLCTFGDNDLFAYLCAHGAVDRWFRLKWLADIGALLAQQSQGGAERLYQAAQSRGMGRAAAQAMLLCHSLLAAPLPERLLANLNRSVAVRCLHALAMNAIVAERKPTELPFSAILGSTGRFLLGRDWRYWLTELRLFLIRPTDILTLPLPRSLQGLYPILHLPLWLWRRIRPNRSDRSIQAQHF
jgi:hypothetical protein